MLEKPEGSQKKNSRDHITRRDFVKRFGAVAIGASVSPSVAKAVEQISSDAVPPAEETSLGVAYERGGQWHRTGDAENTVRLLQTMPDATQREFVCEAQGKMDTVRILGEQKSNTVRFCWDTEGFLHKFSEKDVSEFVPGVLSEGLDPFKF